jgi:hypothetical protein
MSYDARRSRAALALCAIAAVCLAFASPSLARTKKPSLPPYRSSGVIHGTDLTYSKLRVSDDGTVAVTVSNKTRRGLRFTANFSYYGAGGSYLTGFTVQGYAEAGKSYAYSLELDDYRAYKKAAGMKVLGRAGEASRPADGGE